MKSRPTKEAAKGMRHNPLPDKRPNSSNSNNKHHRKLHGRGGPSNTGKRAPADEEEVDEEDGEIDLTEGVPDKAMRGVRFEDDDEDNVDFDDEDDDDDNQVIASNIFLRSR